MEICAEEEWRGRPERFPNSNQLLDWTEWAVGFPAREREKVGEQDGWVKMREKEQQCDPAEFMIVLLKHMPVMVKMWYREHAERVSVHINKRAYTVFVPSGCVCITLCECVCWQGYEVVKGNFSCTFLRVGYHKIAEIPAGARNISIQETVKSRNYLGTHSHMPFIHTHTMLSTNMNILSMANTSVLGECGIFLQLCRRGQASPSSMETG